MKKLLLGATLHLQDFPDDEMRKKVRLEFSLFASGSKLTPYPIKNQNDMGAITWWYMYGQPFKHLQPLAIKILSQVSFHLFIYLAIVFYTLVFNIL